jgi:gamma-glutamylcyclotransferase (GGCT)/AIG2-like uncharacterized protein YtfP
MFIFVYGTLQHGFPLNKTLTLNGARYHGWGFAEGVRLYGWEFCPGAYSEVGYKAWGEIYEIVDEELLNRLDSIEAMYTRHPVTVTITEGSTNLNPLAAEIYLSDTNPVGGAWIDSGVFQRKSR